VRGNIVPLFPRIHYDEAIERLHQLEAEATDPEQQALLHIEWDDDFGSPPEAALTQLFDKPVFVVGYLTQVKAFYMEPWPGRPEVCKSADLLAPEGYGEIIGGSERMSDPDLLIQRIHDHGLPMEPDQWYVDLRKCGSVPHSGFGIGVERTVGWICGLEHIREASPFLRLINRLYP
jgi:asparaginyl-tRNA synthetase